MGKEDLSVLLSELDLLENSLSNTSKFATLDDKETLYKKGSYIDRKIEAWSVSDTGFPGCIILCKG